MIKLVILYYEVKSLTKASVVINTTGVVLGAAWDVVGILLVVAVVLVISVVLVVEGTVEDIKLPSKLHRSVLFCWKEV